MRVATSKRKIGRTAALALLCWLPATAGLAQEAAAPVAWTQQWNDLYARDDLDTGGRLLMQSELVRQAGAATGWRNAEVWDWTRQVLSGWEASADLERAYATYLSILEQIGVAAQADDAPLPDEAALRDYYQRALTIARTPAEEGRLLLYLAESLLRSSPHGAEARRRAEACLQQAALALAGEPPIDAVHLRLAQLYAAGEDAADAPPDGGESRLSQVVFHYRYILELENAREPYRAAAEAALDTLLQPGLELRIGNRFLPANEIRIAVDCRNLPQLHLEIYALPWQSLAEPVAHARMAADWLAGEPPPEALVLERTVAVTPRQRYDWESHEIRLSEDFASGWYRVRIRAGGLEAQDLMLVTPLEVAAIPRPDGGIALWVVDAETGNPVPNAAYHVLGTAGELVQSGVCDADGLGTIDLDGGIAWQEIHVTDGVAPALVRAQEARDAGRQMRPWLIPAANSVRPGDTLSWMLLGGEPAPAGASVQLPDGTALAATLAETGPQVAQGSVAIPAAATASGPLVLELPDQSRIHLAHLDRVAGLPLGVELTGERCESGTQLFLASSPVRVRIFRSILTEEPPPEYLRVSVAAIDRQLSGRDGERGTAATTLHESILTFGRTDGGPVHFDLPEVGDTGDVRILRIDVHALDRPDLLGQAHLALLPYRTLVRLRLDQQLVRTGDTVRVDIDPIRASESGQRPAEGELVVFRETWESRFIHRKKGTLISEAEFAALPDRSLLGSAKTDYRLLEQGFLREEVARIAVDASAASGVPIKLERAGSYRIEFAGRDSETRPAYPGGPLEVWVVPEPPDLRAFRSEAPRLEIERDADGSQQVLVLLDRKEVSVLLDLEHADGSVVTRVLKPVDNALYVETGPDEAALTRARAVVVGDRRTNLLCGRIDAATPVRWNLMADRSVGLNPGTAFDWSLEPLEGPPVQDVLYMFYPDSVTRPLFSFLEWQQQAQRARLHSSDPAIASLGKWLPVYHPLVPLESAPAASIAAGPADIPTPERLLNLYPELMVARPVQANNRAFARLPGPETGGSLPVRGTLPDAAGRWSFTVLSLAADGHLDWQSWPLSTELPIRSTLSGPPLVRAGDQPLALLALENTTRAQARLDVEFSADGSLQLAGADKVSRELAQRQREEIPVEVTAAAAGAGTVRALARGSNSTSEASLAIAVAADTAQPVIQAYAVPAGAANWSHTARIAGWQQPRLVVSAGLGGVLPEIWPPLRRQLAADPLLAALGDWAFERVASRQGMPETTSGGAAALLDLLQRHHSGGGWGWTPGQAPDPWLSALVLWALETFSSLADQAFEPMRADARDYLESALVEEELPMDARLAALHALAAPAYNDPRVRPSRIQARTFLGLLHDRDQLSNAGFATLLQVARAYHFSEEVRLLAPELTERVRLRGIPPESGFHARTLIHMAFGEIPGAEALRASVLQGAIESLSASGVRRSWLQFGGLLNLLATFLWEGDFNVEGSVNLVINDAAPAVLDLAPDSPGNGCLKVGLETAAELRLGVDASAARLPLLVLLLGNQAAAPARPAYPEQSETLLREFVETTLLAGQRQEISRLEGDAVLHSGDILQVVLSMYVENAEPFGEFHFMIPAAAALSPDAIQHSFEPSSTEAILEPPLLGFVDQQDPLRQILRMEPLAPGRHEFILSYRVNWPGSCAFPAHILYLPKSGQAFSVGSARRLQILP